MLKEINNAITTEQSKELIEIAEKNLVMMTTLGREDKGYDYRSAQGTWLPNDLELSKYIKSMISNQTDLPVENMEDLHIVRYDVGGQYKEHYDFFFPNQDYYEANCTQRGGQRLKSALIYLNDDFEGGETEFINLKLKVKPEINKMIIWDNIKQDGSLNYESLHAGLPVKSGVKYICIVWIRENKFV
jgi:prolyl 4-hydroxylase